MLRQVREICALYILTVMLQIDNPRI